MFRYFTKQYLCSRSFLLSVGMLYFFLLVSAYGDIAIGCDAFLTVQITNVLGVSVLLRPLAAALPISLFLMREWGSHYFHAVLSRGSRFRYAWSKTVSACMVGFLVPFLANILLVFTIAAVTPGSFDPARFDPNGYFPEFTLDGRLYLTLLLYITGFSFSGAVWATVITAISSFSTNGYILIAAPFLLDRTVSYVLNLISLRTPVVLCFDTSNTYAFRIQNGLLLQLIFVLLLVFLTAAILLMQVKRRLRNG